MICWIITLMRILSKGEKLWNVHMGMLFPIILLYVASYVSGKFCENNQFWSTFLERCENCSKCVHPDIIIRPCQRHKDTVCGPLSELNVDWSFLRHPDTRPKTSNPQKEMLQTFKENFEGIRQHEKHMREKQRYLHERQKILKDSGEDYNEIEDGDILVGEGYRGLSSHSKRVILKKLMELGSSLQDTADPEKKQKEREKRRKLFQTLIDFLAVSDSASNDRKLHFDDDEAFELLRSGKKKLRDEKKEYDPNNLKFDDDGVLIKDFGFSRDNSEAVRMEKLIDDGKYEQKPTSTEKVSRDWRLATAAGLLITHTIVILVIVSYCIRKNGKKIKDYFVADIGEVQTWMLPKDKESKYPTSGIYKPTTEVRTSSSSGKCKYLERIINKNGKKKVNLYVGVKLPPEMKPLTGKYPDIHKPIGENV